MGRFADILSQCSILDLSAFNFHSYVIRPNKIKKLRHEKSENYEALLIR
jgi:hypothetical protein